MKHTLKIFSAFLILTALLTAGPIFSHGTGTAEGSALETEPPADTSAPETTSETETEASAEPETEATTGTFSETDGTDVSGEPLPEPPAASLELGPVLVQGTVGRTLSPVSFSITPEGTVFSQSYISAVTLPADITAWFESVPEGLRVTLTGLSPEQATAEVSGKPAEAADAELVCTVPAGSLEGFEEGLSSGYAEASRWSISLPASGFKTHISVTGLDYPTEGKSPDRALELNSGLLCPESDVTWSSADSGVPLSPDVTFSGGESYTLQLLVTPDSGEAFGSELTADVLFGVSGVISPAPSEHPDSVLLSYSFTAARAETLEISASMYPSGAGTLSGTGSYGAGEQVTLKARPGIGYVFINWSTSDNRIVSKEPIYSFTATEDVELMANFSETELSPGTLPVIFTESSSACCGGSMIIDLDSMSKLDSEFAAAVKNETVNFQWYKNEKPLPQKNGQSFTFTAIDVGHSFYVQAVYGDKFIASVSFTVEARSYSVDVERVFGSDRYATALAVADKTKELLGISQFEAVIVASGEDFADALSGSYLAHVKNAPILLVKDNSGSRNTVREYILENLAPGGTVYILGGTAAVSDSMENGLEGFTVKRLGGRDRYETNLLILGEAGVSGGDILVCTGRDFADSLSASAAKRPILLVKNSLSEGQKTLLSSVPGTKYIVGGTAAVSKNLEAQLSAFGTVKRLGGADRYETSVLVAREFFGSPEYAVLAYAQNFPDGISGAPLALAKNAPLILTAPGKESPAAGFTADKNITKGFVLGGSGLITDKCVGKIFPTIPDTQEWNLILVNPWNPLLSDPDITLKQLNSIHSVDERIYPELQQMLDDARAQGLNPVICSSYRTMSTQKQLYAAKVAQYVEMGYPLDEAEEIAATIVAVPGTSEHHTGLALDIVARSYQMLDKNQENTAEQKWLMANSWRYGFILRYPNGSTDITGIIYEPWHYRYVGKTAAEEIYTRGITLEEYLEDYYG